MSGETIDQAPFASALIEAMTALLVSELRKAAVTARDNPHITAERALIDCATAMERSVPAMQATYQAVLDKRSELSK